MKRQELYHPLLFGGLKSAQDALALGPGDCYDSKNLRKDVGGPIKVRAGTSMAVTGAGGLPTGSFRGMSEPYNDGTYIHLLMAWKETSDGKVHIWHKKYTIATDTWDTNWVELTKESGKFGDTTLAEPKNGRVQFTWCEAVAQSRLAEDNPHTIYDDAMCVISDGNSTRIVNLFTVLNGPALGDSDSGLGHAKGIEPPKGNLGVEWDAHDWLDVRNAAVSATGSGAGEWGTVAQAGSAGARRWEFTTGTVSAGGSTAYIAFSSEEATYATYTANEDYFWPHQVWLIAHSADDNFWRTASGVLRWKVSGGAYASLTLPNKPLVLPTGVADYEFVVYDLPDQLPEQAGDLLANGFGFTTGVETPSTNLVTIYGFGFGGVTPGGSEYGIARRQITTHVHSPGVVMHNTAFKVKKAETRKENAGILNQTDAKEFNGVTSATVYTYSTLPADFTLPIDSRVYYTCKLSFSNPYTADLTDNAADGVVFYRKEPGDSDFYRVARYSAALYANVGGWTLDSGSASSTLVYTDTVLSEWREYSDRLPDSACAPPPPYLAGLNTNGRSVFLQNYNTGTNVRISEYNQALRFINGAAQEPDSKSGFNIRVPNETGRAVAAGVSGGVPATILVATDKNVYNVKRLEGDGAAIFYLAKESSRGCSAGLSFCDVDGQVSWLDRDRDFRIGGEEVSRTTVSDKLYAIPDAYANIADAVFFKGRVYLAYATSGQTENKQVLVWNAAGQYWECYDTLTSGKEVQQWIEWRQGGSLKLYYVASDGAIYEYEKSGQTTDAGTAIAFAIETGEFHNDRFDPVYAESIGVIADKVSVTLDTLRTDPQTGTTEAGTLDLSTGGSRTWKWDTTTGKSGIPGLEGAGIRLKVSGSFSVACSFYSIVAEMEGTELGGAER